MDSQLMTDARADERMFTERMYVSALHSMVSATDAVDFSNVLTAALSYCYVRNHSVEFVEKTQNGRHAENGLLYRCAKCGAPLTTVDHHITLAPRLSEQCSGRPAPLQLNLTDEQSTSEWTDDELFDKANAAIAALIATMNRHEHGNATVERLVASLQANFTDGDLQTLENIATRLLSR